LLRGKDFSLWPRIQLGDACVHKKKFWKQHDGQAKRNRLLNAVMKNQTFWGWAAWIASALVAQSAALAAPVALKCEYRVNPEGIDELKPRLSWQIESNARGAKQTAYEILVASSAEDLAKDKGDLWDSGRVESNDTVNVVYSGAKLESKEPCFWKVRVWDEGGRMTTSAPAQWSMGLLYQEDWKGDYISFRDDSPVWKKRFDLLLPPARQYRKEFLTTHKIKRATIYATALGTYELWLNGQRVSDARMMPGWTDYRQRAYYNTYDVTPLVVTGANALGAWVADGWYAGYLGFGIQNGLGPEHTGRSIYGKTPSVMAQLEIEYDDGSKLTVPTDATWRVTGDGPVREGDFLMGETYDARKETTGWTKPGFDDEHWEQAILASQNASAPATFYEDQNGEKPGDDTRMVGKPVDLGFKRPPILEAYPGIAVRPTEEIRPVSVTRLTNDVYIYNMGQNFAGVVRLRVKGPAGTTVRLRYGEQLHSDGSLMTENLRKARATDYYILRGGPADEVYTPRFTIHGFQYVEVTGYPGRPGRDAITGVVIGSDTPLTSGFECSDPTANRLFKNVVWTQRANFVDLPTDCPQRDERFGWMGDAQIYAHCATLNADVAAFYTKWLREVMESQRPSGTFPGYCPFPFQTGWDFGTAWCDAGVIVPWTVWRAYDDTRIIERSWRSMTRFMDWRQSTSTNFLGIAHGNDWGDWLSFGVRTPLEYVDTVYFAHTARLMSEMAAAIGKDDESEAYERLFDNIKKAFDEKYVQPDGTLKVDNETAYALALYMDLLPEDQRHAAGAILVGKLTSSESTNNSGVTTGFLGTQPLLPVLTSLGENDLAAHIFQGHKFPSWDYEVDQGATTIWERWNGYTKEFGFGGPDGTQNASMNSFAHYSFGAVCEWMINDLAGIQSEGPGYQKVIIHPHPPTLNPKAEHPPINWVKAHYDSIHGRIVSEWRRTKSRFDLTTTIPANTTATIYLPASDAGEITESGQPVKDVKDIKILGKDGGWMTLSVPAGTYRFRSQM
jgi:alpha-L-rhamnosidase